MAMQTITEEKEGRTPETIGLKNLKFQILWKKQLYGVHISSISKEIQTLACKKYGKVIFLRKIKNDNYIQKNNLAYLGQKKYGLNAKSRLALCLNSPGSKKN